MLYLAAVTGMFLGMCWLFAGSKVHRACPYCMNPNRDDVAGCRFDRRKRVEIGFVGEDPPCQTDAYGAEHTQ